MNIQKILKQSNKISAFSFFIFTLVTMVMYIVNPMPEVLHNAMLAGGSQSAWSSFFIEYMYITTLIATITFVITFLLNMINPKKYNDIYMVPAILFFISGIAAIFIETISPLPDVLYNQIVDHSTKTLLLMVIYYGTYILHMVAMIIFMLPAVHYLYVFVNSITSKYTNE